MKLREGGARSGDAFHRQPWASARRVFLTAPKDGMPKGFDAEFCTAAKRRGCELEQRAP